MMAEDLATPRRVRIFLIDDHPVVREGLARAFAAEGDFEIAGEASTAAEALAQTPSAHPDLVVVDLHLPDRDGPDLIAALRAVLPNARLVVVSGYDDEYRVTEALRAGAHGYLLKTSPLEQIVAGIREAAAGGTPLSPQLTEGVLRAMRKTGRNGGPGAIDVLTAREIQVLRLFASGRSTREVAQSLGISPKTVETHRIRIYDKLGCKGVVDLTRIAVRSGLVEA
ncbi:Two-component response regulator [Minicystis rosea]|nr:Two-component response regulator [Minicystis rosea]